VNRALWSLYLLIVLTAVGAGLALDAVWNAYAREQPGDRRYDQYLALAETFLLAQPVAQRAEAVAALDQGEELRFGLVTLADFAATPLLDKLQQGEVIHVAAEGEGRSYKRLGTGQRVISLSYPLPAESGLLRRVLALVFYGAIALGVLLWVWPLSRDLRRLEKHIAQLGADDSLLATIFLPPNSALAGLARTFNGMTRRIRALVQSQQDMSHAISHELRTPLARMKFALEMAQSNPDPETLRQRLAGMRQDVAEMGALVDELLEYASLEQSGRAAQLETGDLPGLARQVLDRAARGTGSTVRVELIDQLPRPAVRGDWRLLELALSNLLQNALRHARSRVCVTLLAQDGLVGMDVDDDGPGVPPAHRYKVFQSFVRLRQGDTAPGFGLGLAIVRNIADKHGGSVAVGDSSLGGARFSFRWPG